MYLIKLVQYLLITISLGDIIHAQNSRHTGYKLVIKHYMICYVSQGQIIDTRSKG